MRLTLPDIPKISFSISESNPMRTYLCIVCGFIYDESVGRPEDGIAPGTKWDDVPADWACPDCGAGKDSFEMMAI
jgi:rubredoxin